jgi:hypothetical protein
MNELVIIIILLLTPGIIGVLICDALILHKSWDQFKYIIYSFVIGLLSYCILQLIYLIIGWWYNCNLTLSIWQLEFISQKHINWLEILYSIPVSIILSLVLITLINRKILGKFAKYFKISNKYGDEDLFYYFLNSNEINWIYVRDIKNNLTYKGAIDTFSDNTLEKEIVLRDVTVYRYEDSAELYSVPYIYLNYKKDNVILECVPLDKD